MSLKQPFQHNSKEDAVHIVQLQTTEQKENKSI